MQDIQIFHADKFGDIRTLVIDGEPWFVGKDIAAALGYENPQQAIRQHVDDDDRSPMSGVLKSSTPAEIDKQTIVINESGMYSLILRSNKPEARKFKRWVTKEVLPSIRKTGSYGKPKPQYQPLPETKTDAMMAAVVVAEALNLEGSGKLAYITQTVEALGLPTAGLPVYSIDAPIVNGVRLSDSSEVTYSATELLKRGGVKLSAVKFNKLAEGAGLLLHATRPSSKGGEKKFWVLTEKGLEFGKNVTNPKCQRETQPHWFESTFPQVLDLIGVS